MREEVHEIVRTYDAAGLWDTVQARDLPPMLMDYVIDRLRDGWDHEQIRRQLGIPRETDKSWKKITAAIQQGNRVNAPVVFAVIQNNYDSLSNKIKEQIELAFEYGTEVPTKDGVCTIKGPTKELAGMIDAYNRLQQGKVKIGKDLGVYQDKDAGRGGGGVTIVVKSAVQLPAQAEIDKHNKKTIEVQSEVASGK